MVWADLTGWNMAGIDWDIFYRCNVTGAGWEPLQVLSEPVPNDDRNTGMSYSPGIAVENDMIGFMTVNCDPVVAPFGGRSPVLGTNPLSFAIPTGSEKPILIDYATAVVSEGKVREALLKGDTIPEGWILDSSGRPTTNPQDLYKPPLPPLQTEILGALLPFGGHKGYGLNLLVDIFSGALTGAGCDGEVTKGNGVFLMVINPEGFISKKHFIIFVNLC